MTVEHRTWLTILNLPFDDEQAWEPIITALEREHGELGPTISFEPDGSATIVVADDTPDAAHAARGAVAVVIDALRAVGRGDLYPTAVEVALVSSDELSPA
ncbi:MAG: hypothetical protein MSC31_10300 [Solirubrobacteraceae bacterium MAG38_C4-C5]|nr:hypothetical protein [Candidatus Siliceabacter maunaloa]